MKRTSCRPDVVKYIMAALKPEVVCISSTTTCTTFSVLLHMFYNHIIYFIHIADNAEQQQTNFKYGD